MLTVSSFDYRDFPHIFFEALLGFEGKKVPRTIRSRLRCVGRYRMSLKDLLTF